MLENPWMTIGIGKIPITGKLKFNYFQFLAQHLHNYGVVGHHKHRVLN
jgi:hypothetical protein